MKKLLFLMVSLTLLASCGSDDSTTAVADVAPSGGEAAVVGDTTSSNDIAKNYSYQFNGSDLFMGGEFTQETYGEPNEFFEAASCAFEGMDKIFYYSGVEVRTYPDGEQDFVSTILLKDDTVTTAEGAYIGMTMEKVLEKHGTEFTQDGNLYFYQKGDSTLTFISEDDVLISITYSLDGIEH